MKAKVARCPWCNSHSLSADCNQLYYWLACLDCGSAGPIALTVNDAIDRWNGDGPLERQNPHALVRFTTLGNRSELREVEL